MKGSRLYVLTIILFTALIFLFELSAPKKFVWKPTYDKNDREPFGSYVFDDVLSSSTDNYQVVNKTFYQIWEEDSTAAPKAFLLTEDLFEFTETDVNYMLKLLHNGNQIMICTDKSSYRLKDTLKISIENTGYYNYSTFNNYNTFNYYMGSKYKHRDSIFLGTDTLHCEQIYKVYPFVHSSAIYMIKWNESHAKDSSYTAKLHRVKIDPANTLAFDKRGRILAMKLPVGKGEIFIVATPLMFTNFGILDEQNASYVFRLLSHIKDKPLVRIEAYGRHSEKPSTPLRYLLITPPLRWAVYTTLLLIMLFMIFTAKRRQRIIPVIETPPNRMSGFIRLISGLYYSRHDNAEILKTKYSVFCAVIKQKTGVDLLEEKPDDSRFARLAEKTGMPQDEIKQLIKEFRLIPYQYDVPDSQMKELMDKMNRIKIQI
jgi:hypothetical protein